MLGVLRSAAKLLSKKETEMKKLVVGIVALVLGAGATAAVCARKVEVCGDGQCGCEKTGKVCEPKCQCVSPTKKCCQK